MKKVVKKLVAKKKTLKKAKLAGRTKKVSEKPSLHAQMRRLKRPVKKPSLRDHLKKLSAHKRPIPKALALKRFIGNPIIAPRSHVDWESRAAFNPAAVYLNGRVHIIYRAVGRDDISVLGYAASSDGFNFNLRPLNPAYAATRLAPGVTVKIPYSSGGGTNGGCEDPRLTRIGDRVYMLYTNFDGWGSVRISLTSISAEDFVNQRWNWRRPVFISPPNEIHKNWVLFPGLINGKFAILHGISPDILIDYFDSLEELDETKFIQSIHIGHPRWQLREKGIRGVGPPPIRTPHGWLVLYHLIEEHDPGRYKLFALLLDLKDPTKVICRSKGPVLEPDEAYENIGHKSGIVYSCGAVVKDNLLIVFYGGADTVTCVASAPFDAFVKELIASGRPKLSAKGNLK